MRSYLILVCSLMLIAQASCSATESAPTASLLRRCRRPGQVKGADGRQCRAQIPSWYWDDARRDCAQFMFTGCNETDNLFQTKEQCLGTCQMMQKATPCPPPQNVHKGECELKTVLAVEDGCRKHYVHCHNKTPRGACPATATARPPPDCEALELKDNTGCTYIVFDCTKGK